MDCQQDLAIGTLTILDQNCDSSLLCNGNALFKNSVKIHNSLHLFNDIRLCGNIVPLKHTSSIGTNENPWMDLYVTDGNFNTLNVDALNVKQINYSHYQPNNENDNDKSYNYYNIGYLYESYDNIDIKYCYDDDKCEVNIDIKLKDINFMILNLSNVNLDFIDTKSSDMSLHSVFCISDSKIYVNITLPEMTHQMNNKCKVMVINPNNYNIKFLKQNINNNSSDQSYKFIYIDEIKNWLLKYRL